MRSGISASNRNDATRQNLTGRVAIPLFSVARSRFGTRREYPPCCPWRTLLRPALSPPVSEPLPSMPSWPRRDLPRRSPISVPPIRNWPRRSMAAPQRRARQTGGRPTEPVWLQGAVCASARRKASKKDVSNWHGPEDFGAAAILSGYRVTYTVPTSVSACLFVTPTGRGGKRASDCTPRFNHIASFSRTLHRNAAKWRASSPELRVAKRPPRQVLGPTRKEAP
jgi:hypothetical protein